MFFKIGGNARLHHFKRQLPAIHAAVQPYDMKSIPALNRLSVNDPGHQGFKRLFKFWHSLARTDLSQVAASLAGRAGGMLPGPPRRKRRDWLAVLR